jgi:hypothetical protein
MKKCVRIGIYDPPLEECDNGVGCLSNCLCNSQMGYRPTTPFSIDCDGCGNSIWDVDEECDNGVGCLSNCSCNKIQQYVSTIPPSINCTKCGNGILDVGEQCDSGISIKNKSFIKQYSLCLFELELLLIN